VVAGIRGIDAIEFSLGAEEPVGQKLLKADVSAAVRIQGYVARVADPCKCRAAHARSRRKLRDCARIDLQAAGFYFHSAEIDFVDEGVGPGEPGAGMVEVFGPAECAFEARG